MTPQTRSRGRQASTSTEGDSERNNSPSPVPDTTANDIDNELERQTQLRNKMLEVQRLRQEIRELHERISNDRSPQPTPNLDRSEESERPRKRQRNDTEELVRRRLKAKEPDKYFGKSLKELEIFLRDCRNYIRLEEKSFIDEAEKVHWAVTFVKGDPADSWCRYEKDTYEENHGNFTWKEFENFLKDYHSDPVNRHITALQKYENARQKENQTAQHFSLYLEELEASLPPYDEQQRAGHLFTKLKPSLKKDILAKGDIPSTRRGVLALAQRFEGIAKIEMKQQSDSHKLHYRSDSYRPNRRGDSDSKHKSSGYDHSKNSRSDQDHPKHGNSDRPRYVSGANRRPIGDKSQVECYTCHKKGHYANECRSRNPAEKEKTGS